MSFKDVLTLILGLLVMLSTTFAGGKSGHVHHRIHVPAKVKTVYITKFIKIPEHHHYFHEKEKQIVVDHHAIHRSPDHDYLLRSHDLGHKDVFHSTQSHHDFKGYFYK